MDGMDAGQRRERKDVRRNLERVLQAAHELFAERGADVTMEEVARRAGVGVGTVYRRFPSKEHLFAAVSHAACSEAQQCLRDAAQSEPDPVRKLRILVRLHYQRLAAQSALFDLRPASAAAECATESAQVNLYATLQHMLQHVIVEGQRQGVIAPGDAALLSALCLQLLHPRVYDHLQQLTGSRADDVAEYVVRFMLTGLAYRR